MRRNLVWTSCLAVVAGVPLYPLWAQQRVFESLKASPDRIQTGSATITVEAVLRRGIAPDRMMVRLERILPNALPQSLGNFRNEGGRLTIAVTFREQAPGRIQLRAVAVPASAAMVALPRPSYSDPLFISVAQAAPTPPAQPLQVFRSLKASPDRIETGEANVTLQAVLMREAPPRGLTVRLERILPNIRQPQVLGDFRDAGRGVYTMAVTFRERVPGTIQLRAVATPAAIAAAAAPRQSYSDPLFITVAQAAPVPPVKPQPVTQQARGFSAAVPDGFVWNTKVTAVGGPWSVNNFDSRYLRGGVVPAGGCEIEGTSAPPGISAAEQLQKDMPGTRAREFSANGHSALRIQQDDEAAPGLTYRILSAYIDAGRSTYKLFATFRAGDGVEPACRLAFDRVLESFTPSGGR